MENTDKAKEMLPGREGRKAFKRTPTDEAKRRRSRNQLGRVKRKDDRFDNEKTGDLGPSS